ncbi:hypothetical protein PVK06_016908 [Gossypium arboreum]|uniref:Protein kinase domain-containing protein n=1 Tax=Gossypium arboreum TaxID=29729 RepID=A0ABR0Q1H1_GOSAR|nr:hypothetical protein PVK06_016908 [Gossypium arboreum]
MGGSRSYSANPSDYKLLEEIGYGASATVYRAIFLPTNDIGLIEGISSVLNKRKEDEKSLTELTRTDIIKCIQSKRVKFRGVNLSSLDLSKLDLSFVDFSFACLKNVFSHVQIFSVQNFGMWMLWVRIFTMQLCASKMLRIIYRF